MAKKKNGKSNGHSNGNGGSEFSKRNKSLLGYNSIFCLLYTSPSPRDQ